MCVFVCLYELWVQDFSKLVESVCLRALVPPSRRIPPCDFVVAS